MRTHRFLRRKAASQYLEETWRGPRPQHVGQDAVLGGGPTFRRAGRVPLYSADDLDEWVASKLSPPMRSTSEAAVAGHMKTGKTDARRAAPDEERSHSHA